MNKPVSDQVVLNWRIQNASIKSAFRFPEICSQGAWPDLLPRYKKKKKKKKKKKWHTDNNPQVNYS